MTAITVVSKGDNTLTSERIIKIDNITVTSDYTYTPSNPTGGTLKVISCYNCTDGASVVCTVSSNVITLGHGQTLSAEDVMLMYTFV
jgi:hypothetical protein